MMIRMQMADKYQSQITNHTVDLGRAEPALELAVRALARVQEDVSVRWGLDERRADC